MGWIGIDLDGTLAEYAHGQMAQHGVGFIGRPVPAMLERVRGWLEQGKDVKIMTARASIASEVEAIELWCLKHVGRKLPVTDKKDFAMIELWDDRAIQVGFNTGIPMSPKPREWEEDVSSPYHGLTNKP